MTDQPGSARFQALLESALQVYEKKAGVTLANLGDSLVIQLQRCHSIDDITTLLQDKAQAFDDLQQRDRIFKSIKATVSILTPVSGIASVADDAGLVRQKILKACLAFLTVVQTLLPHTKAISSTIGILLNVCAIPRFMRRCSSDVQVNQVANGVITSCDALAEMLESMERLMKRLRIYAETSHPMLALDAMVVELMVELITTLALVTRKLKKRRSRESFFANMLLYSSRRSQMGKELFRGQGYQ
jgi:hypothetical protein